MSDDNPQYVPSDRFDNVNALFDNHYRFELEALPDLTFRVQTFTLPSVSSTIVPRKNPFVDIPETGDHLTFSAFQVGYQVDNAFKSYFSLFCWLKGYGFPNSYEEIGAFEAARASRLPMPRPSKRELHKTKALLTILQPDNDTPLVEIAFLDVFPVAVGEVPFATIGSEPTYLKTNVTFAYSDFDVKPLA